MTREPSAATVLSDEQLSNTIRNHEAQSETRSSRYRELVEERARRVGHGLDVERSLAHLTEAERAGRFTDRGRSRMGIGSTCIIGFDSAWTDSSKAPGAVCALVVARDGTVSFEPPRHASFDQALEFIEAEGRACDTCLVALDQPTIVANETGSRPVDKVAGSLVSFIGGGVQPANRSKKDMFGDGAPIWRFLQRLGAKEDPELSRAAERGLFIMEVFPALALPAFDARFNGRMKAPKYNPANKKKFRRDDWFSVIETVARYGLDVSSTGIKDWTEEIKRETHDRSPRKADQDQLDAVLCALIGYHWRFNLREHSIMIGDLTSGYMIAPTDANTRCRLATAAAKRGVPVDGMLHSALLEKIGLRLD
jgi:predicted RNase H-like nuclease